MTLLNFLINTFQGADRPPVSTARTLAEKDALAQWIVKSYFDKGSSTLESVLEREADIRFCSLLARHLCVEIFGASGAGMMQSIKNVTDAMGLRLEVQKSGRLADTRSLGSFATPVKYKGFGSTLNNPDARGHLFQINMLSFIERKPIIGVNEVSDGPSSYPTKGMHSLGRRGSWNLFELDPQQSDDMTALLVRPDKNEIKMEFAYFASPADNDVKMLYRLNTE